MHLTDSGGTGTHTMLQLNNTGGSVAQFNIVGNDLLINATSDLILQNSGANIGIGTTSPAVLLHLSSSSANQFRIEIFQYHKMQTSPLAQSFVYKIQQEMLASELRLLK